MLKIIDINIQRANIILKLNSKITSDSFLVQNNKKIKLDTNKDELIINIVNTPEGSALEEGKYFIEVNNEILTIDSNMVSLLDDKSRIFKYRDGIYALLLSFDINENYNLFININYMIKNNKYKKFIRLAEEDSFKKKIIKLFKIVSLKICNIIYQIIFFFNKNNNNVLFLSESYNELSPNLKYFYNYIKDDNYKIKIYTSDKDNLFSKLKELLLISSCKYILMDNYVSLISPLNISSKQILVQFWHAGVGFKAVGYARFGQDGSPHPFVSAHRKYTYVVVDNEELINIYKEVFGCKKDIIIPSGMPRLDNYLNKQVIANKTKYLFDNYPYLVDKKIILFAPTYRGIDKKDAYYDYSVLDLNAINNYAIKNNFIFIIKMHPFINKHINLNNYSNIVDLSEIDINDLIYISDILISDYSSCVYEFSKFNRPIIFYRYDKASYEHFRPLHTINCFSKDQIEVETFDELLNALNKYKNIDINNRFTNINSNNNKSCGIIKKKVFGDNDR
ncbi:MAG: CDP-glycerol glycerophosphotransferase family protein [Bacilli bacterium]|nr:CDP-glycerol glycerophosphotransferase family protein [Bacilli bacterium]